MHDLLHELSTEDAGTERGRGSEKGSGGGKICVNAHVHYGWGNVPNTLNTRLAPQPIMSYVCIRSESLNTLPRAVEDTFGIVVFNRILKYLESRLANISSNPGPDHVR